MSKKPSARVAFWVCLAVAATLAAGCNTSPPQTHLEWVARDAWDVGCAHAATVERFTIVKKGFVPESEVYRVDIDAAFKLINPCTTSSRGAPYKQFESVPFVGTAKMVRCESDGKKGWALEGRADRCWSGPTPPFAKGPAPKAKGPTKATVVR